jgi:hypothetical protein
MSTTRPRLTADPRIAAGKKIPPKIPKALDAGNVGTRRGAAKDEDNAPKKKKRWIAPPEHIWKKGRSGNPKFNKATLDVLLTKRQQALEEKRRFLAAEGLSPLEFLLSVMRDGAESKKNRITAARAAAPYLHRKMPIAIEGGDPNRPIVFEANMLAGLTVEEKVSLLGIVEKMAQMQQMPSTVAAGKQLIAGVATREADSDDADELNDDDEEGSDDA